MDDGHQLLEKLVEDGFAVTAAFWVRTREDGPWHLYIASPAVGTQKIGEAYGVLYSSLHQLVDAGIELSEIRLIPDTDPSAAAVIKARDRDPGRMPIKYPGNRLGNLSFEEAYLYPPLRSRTGRSRWQKTRIIGRREDQTGASPGVVEEVVGVVEGTPGERAFDQAWLRLINEKFGDVDGLASHYPNGLRLEFVN
jgi:hypothetical protein